MQRWYAALVGDGGDDGGGRISPEHPSPILHAPRDIISRKGKSLTPIRSPLRSIGEFYRDFCLADGTSVL